MDTKFYALYGLDTEYIMGHKKAAAGELRSPAAAKYFQTELFFFSSVSVFSVLFCFISKTGFSHFS
jgi:hypothetical protein